MITRSIVSGIPAKECKGFTSTLSHFKRDVPSFKECKCPQITTENIETVFNAHCSQEALNLREGESWRICHQTTRLHKRYKF
jgi:hypothetical protein